MKRNVNMSRVIITILTAMLISVLLPTTAFAAKTVKTVKTRRVQSEKEYNAEGELTYQWDYSYNSHGDITKMVITRREYNDETNTYAYVKSTENSTYKYNPNGTYKKSTHKYSDGDKSEYTYNKNGNTKKYVSTYKNNEGKTVTETTTYKLRANGTRKSSVTKRGKTLVAKTTCNSKGNTTKEQHYDSTGKKVVSTITYSYKYNSKGRMLKQTKKSSDGTTETYSYDSKGRMKQWTEKKADGSSWDYKYTYDKKGHQTKTTYTNVYAEPDGTKNTFSGTTTYKYILNKDGTVKEQSSYGNDGTLMYRTVYTYTKKKY